MFYAPSYAFLFFGKQGQFLVKRLIKKLQRNLTEPVKFIVIYQTKKISYFLPKKDKIPDLSPNNLVYQFTCPGCNASYIGKTERNLATRLSEHFDPHKSAISKYLSECDYASYLLNMNNLLTTLMFPTLTKLTPLITLTLNSYLTIPKYYSLLTTTILICYFISKHYISSLISQNSTTA